jgi:hypothetical protein
MKSNANHQAGTRLWNDLPWHRLRSLQIQCEAERLLRRTATRRKAQRKKPVLKRLTDSTPWDSFRPHVDKDNLQEHQSNAGHKRSTLHGGTYRVWRDEQQSRCQSNQLLQRATAHAKVIETIIEMVATCLQSQGLESRCSQIIGTTLGPVPRRRNCPEEDKNIKAGSQLEDWQENSDRFGQEGSDIRRPSVPSRIDMSKVFVAFQGSSPP